MDEKLIIQNPENFNPKEENALYNFLGCCLLVWW